MTITEEIQDAMRNGASSMFLIGLVNYYRADPDSAIKAIHVAGELMRKQREVSLSPTELLFQKRQQRKWNDQEW